MRWQLPDMYTIHIGIEYTHGVIPLVLGIPLSMDMGGKDNYVNSPYTHRGGGGGLTPSLRGSPPSVDKWTHRNSEEVSHRMRSTPKPRRSVTDAATAGVPALHGGGGGASLAPPLRGRPPSIMEAPWIVGGESH